MKANFLVARMADNDFTWHIKHAIEMLVQIASLQEEYMDGLGKPDINLIPLTEALAHLIDGSYRVNKSLKQLTCKFDLGNVNHIDYIKSRLRFWVAEEAPTEWDNGETAVYDLHLGHIWSI